MKLFKYKSYAEYVKAQKSANKKKSSNVWAVEENIKFIADYLKKHDGPIKSGICHGTRGGHEQAWFNKHLPGSKTIGTEIGDASAPDTVQWDFNKQKVDWMYKFDFIYSNSFDHAYYPEKTLKRWADQCKIGGLIILEYDRRQEHTGEISMAVNKTDPVSIRLEELVDLIPAWSSSMSVIDILDMPVVTQEWRKSIIIKVG